MQGIEEQQAQQEEKQEMIEMTIKEFMDAARLYLFGMPPAPQPVLARIPARPIR
ncbi:hypothetical protein ACLIKD_03815 [Azonexus sp. IMCC34842]|uniref:hypothetical protein n=1 Tax=Azonexus sp. IMCC34842 TaxID=3420950 RepID=UPI003D13E98F